MTMGRHGGTSYDQPYQQAPDADQAYGLEGHGGYQAAYQDQHAQAHAQYAQQGQYDHQGQYEQYDQHAQYAVQQQPQYGDYVEPEHYQASSGQYAVVQPHPEQYAQDYGVPEQYSPYPQYQQYADQPQYPYEPEQPRHDYAAQQQYAYPGDHQAAQQHGYDPLTDPLYGFPATAQPHHQVEALPEQFAPWVEDAVQQQWGAEPPAQWADPYAGELLQSVPAQYAPQGTQHYAPNPEPEFDPEPAAWTETVYIEPVDELAFEQAAAPYVDVEVEVDRGALPDPDEDKYGYAYEQPSRTAARSRSVGSSGYVPDAGGSRARAVPASSGSGTGSGRAASRRSARTPSRKPRRLVAAGGAVVTGAVLAGVVVMQMPDGGSEAQAKGDTAHTDDPTRRTDDVASRDSERPQVQAAVPGQVTPNPQSSTAAPGPTDLPLPTPDKPLTTTERMKVRFGLDERLALGGKFEVVPGKAAAPAKAAAGGRNYTYRVEIEQGLGLDGALFADAVQQTLNDARSWAHDNKKTFARTDAGTADFVIRLASPGTTHKLCSAAGLDTSIQNVSCDAGGTPWVVINAWRWAQGSPTFGDDMVGYRQMLINHEVGHRLGRNHETEACLPGGFAPVMMQQTKTLEADNGLTCKANPWPYPA